MKKFTSLRAIALALCFIGFSSFHQAFSQVQTARYITINSDVKGFYEYLPAGYNLGTQSYPLLLFFHGAGERGDGSPTQLPLVLRNGIPKLINQGLFPTSFTVNGQTQRFIIISPQFVDVPTQAQVDDIINYSILHYRVNTNRIYLTGLSMGGGITILYLGQNSNYANRIAAIVPIAEAYGYSTGIEKNIALANIAVWATHNDGDPTVSVYNTINLVNGINTFFPRPLAKMSIFQATSHDAWTATYDPNFRENGLNVYEWMLQYQRNIPLPVTLTNFDATLTSPSVVSISWTTSQELNNDHFTLERSANGIDFTSLTEIPGTNLNYSYTYNYKDNAPLEGNNFYRLSQIDIDGKTVYFGIRLVNIRMRNHQIFVLSPIPAKNNLVMQLTHPELGPIEIILSDINGTKISSWKFQKSAYQWQQDINISNLPGGTYILTAIGRSIRTSQKFVKE